MLTNIFILVTFLSFALVIVKSEQGYGFSSGELVLLNPEELELSPKEQTNYPRNQGHRHNRGHSSPLINADMAAPPPPNDIPSRVQQLFNKNDQIEGSNNLDMLAEVKGSAFFKSRTMNVFRETIDVKNHNNDTKHIDRSADMRGENESLIHFRSGGEVHNDKAVKAVTDQDSKHSSEQIIDANEQVHRLMRLKRKDETKEEKKRKRQERKQERKAKRQQNNKQQQEQVHASPAPTD